MRLPLPLDSRATNYRDFSCPKRHCKICAVVSFTLRHKIKFDKIKLKLITSCAVCTMKTLRWVQCLFVYINHSLKGEQHYVMKNDEADSPFFTPQTSLIFIFSPRLEGRLFAIENQSKTRSGRMVNQCGVRVVWNWKKEAFWRYQKFIETQEDYIEKLKLLNTLSKIHSALY